MTAGRVRVRTGHRALSAAALVSVAALSGCGGSGSSRTPTLSVLPLLPDATVTQQAKVCDKGADAYCALELVVVNPHYKSSTALLEAEHRYLVGHGWLGVSGDTGEQKAAQSPGRRWRVTYATALGDLEGTALVGIKRARSITLALSRTVFDRAAAMSLLLEVGPS